MAMTALFPTPARPQSSARPWRRDRKRGGVFGLGPGRAPILLLIASPWIASPLEALDPNRSITQYVRESWIVKDGAPAGTIVGIAQTGDGYLWLGTEGDGLVRFDGVSFVHAEGLDAVIGQRVDEVTSLLSARDGSLWVGTTFGLAHLKDGAWTTYDRGPAKHVFGLHEGADGAIWYGRHWDGIFRVLGGVLSAFPLKGKPRFVTTDLHGTVWAGGWDGLWRIRGDDRRLYSTADGLADLTVNQVYRDREGAVWVGLQVGLTQLREDKIVAHFTTRNGMTDDDVSAIFEDRDGLLWVGTVNGGLNRRRAGRFEALTKALGLTNNRVTAIHEDREGSLWVGTAGGLNRLRNASLLPIGETEGLSAREPKAVAEAKDGTVYVTSGLGGLNRIRGDQVSVLHPVPPSDFDGALFVDDDGGVWTGHGEGIAYRKDGVSRRFATPGHVSALTRDGQGIVFASGGDVYRLTDGRATRYRLADGSLLGPESLGFDYIWHLTVTRDGTLWLATTRGVFAVQDGTPRRVWSEGKLSARWVSQDDDGTMWFGTMTGLVRLKGGSLVTFSSREGLAEDDIHSVLSDRLGSLWMAGSRGLFRVSRRALEDVARGAARVVEIETFGVDEGMRTSVATASYQPSACVTRDGRLWFATTGGVVVADPAHLERNQLPPPVVVEALVADGRPLAKGAQATVTAGTQQLAVHYNGLSLLMPQRVRFRYRLIGYDRDWIDAGGRRVAFYTKLPPGDYRFDVRAANNDGVWSPAGAAISFRLLPLWYQTAWFRLGATLALGAALAGAHALRTRGLRARERKLQARVEKRTAELRREITVREQAERELRAEVAERRKAEAQARETAAFLDSVVENIPAFISVKDAESLAILRLNRPAKEALGLGDRPAEELVGTTDYDLLPRADAEAVRARDRDVLAAGRLVEVGEEPVPTPQGVRQWLTKKIPILDPAGRPRYLLGISEDVTERKRIQELIERQRDELARSNAELEQFASIASHDLQEPLRKVRAFGDRLAAALGDSVPEAALAYLARMQAAAARMQTLIEDLLVYSHVSSRARPLVPVDLDLVLEEVISDLETRIEEVGGRVERTPLPWVLADETQIRQLFQNLLANALKFNRPGVSPVVSVCGREGPTARDVEIEIRDNGIGIENEFLERIFAPFERLNPRSEYPGTGIGLAICRKIAERHRGAITVESRVGEGSVFRVRLPSAARARREVSA